MNVHIMGNTKNFNETNRAKLLGSGLDWRRKRAH